MADARKSSPFGRFVVEGTWLYADSVPTLVRILESDVAFGSGDYEDEPDVAEDKPGPCFYIEWDAAGGGRGSITGPFASVDEAKAHVQWTANGVRWDTT
jgi:hypothetical protein